MTESGRNAHVLHTQRVFQKQPAQSIYVVDLTDCLPSSVTIKLFFFPPGITLKLHLPPCLCSHTPLPPPPPFLHSSATIKCFSRWFWAQQQMQSMVGALLESTHTRHGQRLFMNGPTITHPPPDSYS